MSTSTSTETSTLRSTEVLRNDSGSCARSENSVMPLCPTEEPQETEQQVSDALKQLRISAPSRARAYKRVRFGFVTIRNYDVTMGDNPSVTCGPPISLNWTFDQIPALPVRDFEAFRAANPRAVDAHCLMITADNRRDMLKRVGFTDAQIANNEKRVAKIQKQRARTRVSAPFSLMEQAVRSAGRKLQRTRQPTPSASGLESAIKFSDKFANDPADDSQTASTASTSTCSYTSKEEELVGQGPWF